MYQIVGLWCGNDDRRVPVPADWRRRPPPDGSAVPGRAPRRSSVSMFTHAALPFCDDWSTMELFDGSKCAWKPSPPPIFQASRSAMPFRLRTALGVHQTPLSWKAAADAEGYAVVDVDFHRNVRMGMLRRKSHVLPRSQVIDTPPSPPMILVIWSVRGRSRARGPRRAHC